jgi:hypothetical protein
MQTIQSSFASLLELLDRRIGQMDAFDPRDATDLDTLLHCRERVKIAARTADANDRGSYIEVLQAGAYALGDSSLIRELLEPSLDVV